MSAKTRVPRKIRKIQEGRSKRARSLDALRTSKKVLPLSDYEIWAKNPGRCDSKGVDKKLGQKESKAKTPKIRKVTLTKGRIRRYKVWGEFPATKEPRYYFAKSKEDLLRSHLMHDKK